MALAAHFTGMQIDYIDGVSEVDTRTLPPGGINPNSNIGVLGSWRAHINVMRRWVAIVLFPAKCLGNHLLTLRRMVEQNISSALVFEDDADWYTLIVSRIPAVVS